MLQIAPNVYYAPPVYGLESEECRTGGDPSPACNYAAKGVMLTPFAIMALVLAWYALRAFWRRVMFEDR